MSETLYKVEMLLGHVEIDSFFRFEGNTMIGCSRATHYDGKGNITKVTEIRTGLVMTFD